MIRSILCALLVFCLVSLAIAADDEGAKIEDAYNALNVEARDLVVRLDPAFDSVVPRDAVVDRIKLSAEGLVYSGN